MKFWLVLVFLIGCAPMKQADSDPQTTTTGSDALVARLAAVNVAELATGLASDPQGQALWSEYNDVGLYAALVEDESHTTAVRFAAALMLKSHGEMADPAATAQVFAAALQQDLVGYAYPWGWLWAEDDPLGLLGGTFIDIGRPAVPALTALLDDPTPRDSYLGSEEATEMAMRGYRVKDFAGFYLARIIGVELPYEHDLDKRDHALAALRAKL
ncbi:MAG: hypothetical protein Tsb0020_00990 [Haliangiales bacterium]